MVKHMNFSYSEVMKMPIFERSIYVDMWQKEMEEQKRQYERAKNKKK
jgi:hypothetical protein